MRNTREHVSTGRSASSEPTPTSVQAAGVAAHRDFDEVFRELEAARLLDERLHSEHGAVGDLISSHDRLLSLRAELAHIRAALGTESHRRPRPPGPASDRPASRPYGAIDR